MKYIFSFIVILLPLGLRADEVSDALASPHLTWSAETNSLRSGVFVDGKDSTRTIVIKLPNQIVTKASFAMLNLSTSDAHYFCPKLEQRFDFELFDSTGIAVGKTSEGKKFGKLLDLPPKTSPRESRKYGVTRNFIYASSDRHYKLGDLDPATVVPRCFNLEKPGNYKLTVVQRVYMLGKDNLLDPVVFAPVYVDVRVEKQ